MIQDKRLSNKRLSNINKLKDVNCKKRNIAKIQNKYLENKGYYNYMVVGIYRVYLCENKC